MTRACEDRAEKWHKMKPISAVKIQIGYYLAAHCLCCGTHLATPGCWRRYLLDLKGLTVLLNDGSLQAGREKQHMFRLVRLLPAANHSWRLRTLMTEMSLSFPVHTFIVLGMVALMAEWERFLDPERPEQLGYV